MQLELRSESPTVRRQKKLHKTLRVRRLLLIQFFFWFPLMPAIYHHWLLVLKNALVLKEQPRLLQVMLLLLICVEAIMRFVALKFPKVELKVCTIYKFNTSLLLSTDVEIILNKSIWPLGTLLKEFLSRRKWVVPVFSASISSAPLSSGHLLPTDCFFKQLSRPLSELSWLYQNGRGFKT